MNPDRTSLATIGDLQDLKIELKEEIRELKDELKEELKELKEEVKELRDELPALEVRLEVRITRSLSAEIGRVANVIMEHTTAQIRAAGDHPRAIEDRLDAHIADASVHRRPARARRS